MGVGMTPDLMRRWLAIRVPQFILEGPDGVDRILARLGETGSVARMLFELGRAFERDFGRSRCEATIVDDGGRCQ